MTEKTKSILAFFFLVSGWSSILWANSSSPSEQPQLHFSPTPPELRYSPVRTGPLEVAKVFGRSPECTDAGIDAISQVSEIALRVGLDPKIAAATVLVESGCNPLAVSSRGAVGLTQVRPSVWKYKYDFSRTNLLNPKENMQVGFEILAGLIEQYGTYEGVSRYQGLGIGCQSCDSQYTEKILKFAGRKL